MQVRIGLMGFGRIGRNIFRILSERSDIQVAAISDIADHAGLEYLLKYETIHGRYPHEVSVREGHLYTRGRQIKMLSGRNPGDVDWKACGVDIVIECTGRGRPTQDLRKHIEIGGAERVILCVPPSDEPDVTVVMGINHQTIRPEHKVISNSSITAHCASPIVKTLDEAFGLERLFVTSIHAYTNDQRLADVPANDLRRSRAAGQNIIPTQTGSGDILEYLFPNLKGRVSALALKVPIPNGSLVDMVSFTKKPVTKTAVNEVIRTAAADVYPGILDYSEDPIVSSDVKSSPYSSTFDALGTQVQSENLVKTLAWFDNGWGYAHRAVDLIEYISR